MPCREWPKPKKSKGHSALQCWGDVACTSLHPCSASAMKWLFCHDFLPEMLQLLQSLHEDISWFWPSVWMTCCMIISNKCVTFNHKPDLVKSAIFTLILSLTKSTSGRKKKKKKVLCQVSMNSNVVFITHRFTWELIRMLTVKCICELHYYYDTYSRNKTKEDFKLWKDTFKSV